MKYQDKWDTEGIVIVVLLVLALVFLGLAMSGCMAISNTYRNPDTGQRFTCRMIGIGPLGVAVSGAEHLACINDAKARGFTVPE